MINNDLKQEQETVCICEGAKYIHAKSESPGTTGPVVQTPQIILNFWKQIGGENKNY